MTDNDLKLKIVHAVRAQMDVICPVNINRACMYWTIQVIQVLRGYGIQGILQAGSASWPRINLDQDDGKVATHYSYVFEPQQAITDLMLGRFPEVHVWVAIPKTGEIVDLTTKYLVENCRLAGVDWLVREGPPEFIWDTPQALPPGVVYRPTVEACMICARLMKRI